MATTSGSCCSSATELYHRRVDLETRERISWFLKLKCLPYALFLLVAGVGAVLLILRFIVTPQLKAYVEDARLSSFALTADKRLSGALAPTAASFSAYNISISVALTVRNPNGAIDLTYTKPLVAIFLFDDRRLYNVTVANEGHKHKPHKRDVHLLHTGGDVPYVLDSAAVEEFKKQNATGLFKVEMRLSGEITLGIGNNRVLELSCPLTLRRPPPPPPPGLDTDVVVFHEVDCKPDKPKKIVF